MSRRAVLAGAVAVASLAAFAAFGGDFGTGEDGGATLWVTRDEGRRVLHEADVPAGLTALQALDRVADVRTRYGGRFVTSVDGVTGSASRGADWFYYVNGVLADRGAAEVRLRDGDVVWWDFRRWAGRREARVVVGAFPEPLLRGAGGPPRSTLVRYRRPGERALALGLGRLVRARAVVLDDRRPARGGNVVRLVPDVRAGTPTLRASAAGDNGPYTLVVSETAARRLAADPAAFRFRYEVGPR